MRLALAVALALFGIYGPLAAVWGPPSSAAEAQSAAVAGRPMLAAQPAPLRGRVVASPDPGLPELPLRRARLMVITGGRASPPVYTDESGAFELAVPSSAYTLRVTRSGYAPVDLARPPAGQPLTVVMARAAVVRGRVVDATGDPSVGVPVRLRLVSAGGRTASAAPAEALTETDDRGEFRFGGLPAGRYAIDSSRGGDPTAVLEDMPPEMAAMMRDALAQRSRDASPTSPTVTVDAAAGDDAVITLVQDFPAVTYPYAGVGGIVTGVLIDEFGEPAEAVSVRLWLTRVVDGRVVVSPAGRSRRVDDRGLYRLFHIPAGRYMVVATPDSESEPGGTGPERFLPVYYPGRLEIGAAAEIDVVRAQETPGVDMTVVRSRGARVYGVALSAAGTRLAGTVVLAPAGSSGPLPAPPAASGNGLVTALLSAAPAADGSFEIRNVPPGLYVLQAAATITSSSQATETITINGTRRTARIDLMHVESISEFAMQRLAIADADFGPVMLTAIPTSVVSGRVTVDGPGQLIAPADFELRVANVEQDEVPAVAGVSRRGAEIEPDGRFRLTGLTGRSLIVLARAPAGWWLKSADIGGLNAAEQPVAFGSPADSRDDVTIVLSPTGATISGRVAGAGDSSASSVVVFPVRRELRLSGSRYLRTTSLDSDGLFSLNSFPPGDYYAIAVDAPDGETIGRWEHPEALEILVAQAQRVTLGEGESRSINLRLQRIPR